MDSVSFNLDKRIRFRQNWELIAAVEIPPEGEYILWPSAVPQPPAVVCLHAPNACQIEDGTFHSQSAWEELCHTRIGWLASAFHCVLDNGHAIGLKVRGKYPKMSIAISIVCAPERQQSAARGSHRLRYLMPLESAGPLMAALQIRR